VFIKVYVEKKNKKKSGNTCSQGWRGRLMLNLHWFNSKSTTDRTNGVWAFLRQIVADADEPARREASHSLRCTQMWTVSVIVIGPLLITLYRPWRQFFKLTVWDKVPDKSTLILGDTAILLGSFQNENVLTKIYSKKTFERKFPFLLHYMITLIHQCYRQTDRGTSCS